MSVCNSWGVKLQLRKGQSPKSHLDSHQLCRHLKRNSTKPLLILTFRLETPTWTSWRASTKNLKGKKLILKRVTKWFRRLIACLASPKDQQGLPELCTLIKTFLLLRSSKDKISHQELCTSEMIFQPSKNNLLFRIFRRRQDKKWLGKWRSD